MIKIILLQTDESDIEIEYYYAFIEYIYAHLLQIYHDHYIYDLILLNEWFDMGKCIMQNDTQSEE